MTGFFSIVRSQLDRALKSLFPAAPTNNDDTKILTLGLLKKEATPGDHRPAKNSAIFVRRLQKANCRLLLLSVTLGLAVSCAGGVQRPEPSEEKAEQYCAERPDHENNCMACSALPECGWCGDPTSGKARCQPGTMHEGPEGCRAGWAPKSEDCEAPPPPPPPPP